MAGSQTDDDKLSLDQSTIGPGNTAENGGGLYHDYGLMDVTNTDDRRQHREHRTAARHLQRGRGGA